MSACERLHGKVWPEAGIVFGEKILSAIAAHVTDYVCRAFSAIKLRVRCGLGKNLGFHALYFLVVNVVFFSSHHFLDILTCDICKLKKPHLTSFGTWSYVG